jgi:hypothetical protein
VAAFIYQLMRVLKSFPATRAPGMVSFSQCATGGGNDLCQEIRLTKASSCALKWR